MSSKTFKEILTALSLANILFAGSWRIYLYPPTFEYHIKNTPGKIDYLGIIIGVLILSAIFWGAFRLFKYLYEEKANLLINLAFSTLFLFGLNIFRLQFKYSSTTFTIALVCQIIFLALLAVMFTKWRHYVWTTARVTVLLLSPFVFVTFSQAVLGIVNSSSKIENEISVSNQLKNIEHKAKSEIKNRVIWIVFDEFDYRIPFDLKAVNMPEFQRLKETSLFSTDAHSPARSTLKSIPSLLTGKKVTESQPVGQDELILNFADGTKNKFSQTPNIFSKVRSLGGNTAVDGFYHSYCRVIGRDLSVCRWMDEEFVPNDSLFSATLFNFDILLSQFQLVFSLDSVHLRQTFDKSFIDDKWEIQKLIEERPKRLEDTYQIISDPDIDLALIHMPIPHPPSRYKMQTKEYSPQLQDYVNNLALADEILGDIRKVLEDAGQWDNSTIIISTDHQLRVEMWEKSKHDFTGYDRKLTQGIEDKRIPFFVKLQNQKESVIYDKAFDTILTHDLILDVIKGNINDTSELETWLDTNRKFK